MYGGVRGRKTRVGEKLHRFPPTRFILALPLFFLRSSPPQGLDNASLFLATRA